MRFRDALRIDADMPGELPILQMPYEMVQKMDQGMKKLRLRRPGPELPGSGPFLWPRLALRAGAA